MKTLKSPKTFFDIILENWLQHMLGASGLHYLVFARQPRNLLVEINK